MLSLIKKNILQKLYIIWQLWSQSPKLGPHRCYSDRSCSAEKRDAVCGMCELFNQTRAKVNKTAKLETEDGPEQLQLEDDGDTTMEALKAEAIGQLAGH